MTNIDYYTDDICSGISFKKGEQSFVEIVTNGQANPLYSFTLMMHVYFRDVSDYTTFLTFVSIDGTAQQGVELGQATSSPSLYVGEHGTDSFVTANFKVGLRNSLLAFKWSTIMFTFDHTTRITNMYVNGQGAGPSVVMTAIPETNGNIRIGNFDSSADYLFDGVIGNLWVINRVLTPADMTEYMRDCVIPRKFPGKPSSWSLNHWGRVTHLCISKLTILGSVAKPLSEPMLGYCWYDP